MLQRGMGILHCFMTRISEGRERLVTIGVNMCERNCSGKWIFVDVGRDASQALIASAVGRPLKWRSDWLSQ
jgi:hypothetical protein